MRVCLRPRQVEQQLPGKIGQGLLLRMPNESRREARHATKGARVQFVASSALAGYPPIMDAVALAIFFWQSFFFYQKIVCNENLLSEIGEAAWRGCSCSQGWLKTLNFPNFPKQYMVPPIYLSIFPM